MATKKPALQTQHKRKRAVDQLTEEAERLGLYPAPKSSEDEAQRCQRLAEMVKKRHHDHDDRCLWCGKPWPCADYVDASWALGEAVPQSSTATEDT